MYCFTVLFFIHILSHYFSHCIIIIGFYTITSHSVIFFCPNCQHIFSSSRDLSIHCYSCNNDHNYTPLPSSSTTSPGNSTKHHSTNKTSINDILQNMSSIKKQKTSNTIIQRKLM